MKRVTWLFFRQRGRCCYCQRPMFVEGNKQNDYSDLQALISMPRQTTRRLKLSLEHLRPQGDPLRGLATEQAAACVDCNSRRHSTPWNVFAQERQQLHAGEAERAWLLLGERWPVYPVNWVTRP